MNTAPSHDTSCAAMTAHDWFTLFLRTLGIWELIVAADDGVTVINIFTSLWHPLRTETPSFITHGLAAFLIGIWLLKAAPTIAGFFPGTRRGSPPQQAEPPTPPAMMPRDWFTLALRLFGIYELTVTIDLAGTTFNMAAGTYRPEQLQIGAFVTHLLATFLLTAWLLKSAPGIAAFFYPEPLQSKRTSSTTDSHGQTNA